MNSLLPKRKSERVLSLTACCVRRLVKQRYGYELPFSDCIDLARAHDDLHSAIVTIATKLELHQARSNSPKFALAIEEAKLSSLLATRESIDRTIKVRQTATSTGDQDRDSLLLRESLLRALYAIRRESLLWSRDYGDFLASISALFTRTRRELDKLRLPLELRKEAAAQLEGILLTAIQNAAEIS